MGVEGAEARRHDRTHRKHEGDPPVDGAMHKVDGCPYGPGKDDCNKARPMGLMLTQPRQGGHKRYHHDAAPHSHETPE